MGHTYLKRGDYAYQKFHCVPYGSYCVHLQVDSNQPLDCDPSFLFQECKLDYDDILNPGDPSATTPAPSGNDTDSSFDAASIVGLVIWDAIQ